MKFSLTAFALAMVSFIRATSGSRHTAKHRNEQSALIKESKTYYNEHCDRSIANLTAKKEKCEHIKMRFIQLYACNTPDLVSKFKEESAYIINRCETLAIELIIESDEFIKSLASAEVVGDLSDFFWYK